jgi:hypothetical protein
LVAVIRQENAEYGRAREVTTDSLRRSCRDNLARVLQTLANALPDGEDPWDAPHRTGRERAEQGMPLEAVLHAYRLGGQVIWEALVEEAGAERDGALRELVDGATTVWRVVDRYATAVAAAYRSTENRVRAVEARRRQAVIGALLAGRGSEPNVAGQAMGLLGLPAHGDYLVVVVAAEAPGNPSVHLAEDDLGRQHVISAWSHRGEHEVGVIHLGQRSPRLLLELLAPRVTERTGISPVVAGLAALGEAYDLALLALACADRPTLSWLDDRLPEALVVRSPDLARRMVQLALRPLLDLGHDDRQILVETLEVWLDTGGSPARSAALLYCHRNTVLNRLRRIESLTGRSLSDPRQALVFSLALVAHRLVDRLGELPPPAAAPDQARHLW